MNTNISLEQYLLSYEEAVSECCGATITDNGFCSLCKEHAV